MNLDGLDPTIIGPALAAGLLVVATHVPLGQQVLRRGIIFVDLAVAQIAGLGVLLAQVAGWNDRGWQVQLTAFSAALLGAAILWLAERLWRDALEALIGTLFVLAATAAILVLAGNPHGGEHLKDLLVGQILWVDFGQLLPVAVLYGLILSLWRVSGAGRSHLWFYVLFALSITASVQLVGVYLVFASLIVPALAMRRRQGPLWFGYLIGILGYALGLVAAALLDLPAGAVIVWTLALVALIGARFPAPRATTKP